MSKKMKVPRINKSGKVDGRFRRASRESASPTGICGDQMNSFEKKSKTLNDLLNELLMEKAAIENMILKVKSMME